jgi:chromosome segregation ATPase
MSEHQERAERLEREAEDMEKRSKRLGEDISDAREDWERKRDDESVPGTPPPRKETAEEREPWPDE